MKAVTTVPPLPKLGSRVPPDMYRTIMVSVEVVAGHEPFWTEKIVSADHHDPAEAVDGHVVDVAGVFRRARPWLPKVVSRAPSW